MFRSPLFHIRVTIYCFENERPQTKQNGGGGGGGEGGGGGGEMGRKRADSVAKVAHDRWASCSIRLINGMGIASVTFYPESTCAAGKCG